MLHSRRSLEQSVVVRRGFVELGFRREQQQLMCASTFQVQAKRDYFNAESMETVNVLYVKPRVVEMFMRMDDGEWCLVKEGHKF